MRKYATRDTRRKARDYASSQSLRSAPWSSTRILPRPRGTRSHTPHFGQRKKRYLRPWKIQPRTAAKKPVTACRLRSYHSFSRLRAAIFRENMR